MKFVFSLLLAFGMVAEVVGQDGKSFWLEWITKRGVAPFNASPATYQVFRNVKSFGAKGDGVTDDTAAINAAIAAGSRCRPGTPGVGCQSSTISPATVYFPAGTYLISVPIVPFYMTNLIGNPNPGQMAVLKATVSFSGIALVDGDPYLSSEPAYGTTNVFYRQVRNLVFDMTSQPAAALARGIHWPTAQATSLQNCVFKMSTASGNKHQGVFIENGSGGFMNDLIFYGGDHAMEVGSQQFTSRNLTFYNSATAIYQIWDWSWTYMGLSINNCGVGIDMSNTGSQGQQVGSVVVIDSTFSNTRVGIASARSSTSLPNGGGSLALENVIFSNVPVAVNGPSSTSLAGSSGTITVAGWVQGNVYSPTGPNKAMSPVSSFVRPASLLKSTRYYTRSKPQYEKTPSADFYSVRAAGAKGDGVTDDTTIIQNLLYSATSAGKIIYFDYGVYKITTSITIPPGARIVGESYPTIMGSGPFFSNINNPVPVVQVGAASGQTGVVEWSDMIISTQGAAAGAILIQWNLASPAATPSGMWDVHTRIAGFKGSNLQTPQCAITAAQPNGNCIAAFQSMRVANIGTGLYMENVWLWTADHDLDDAENKNTRISAYAGRGLSVESTTGNLWLIGTAVEHHTLYQYQSSNTKNIFMGFIQTETPYYQPAPKANVPFPAIADRNDPNFSVSCAGKGDNCYLSWGLRVLNSASILVYGAGLYSFFNNYSLTCSDHTASVYNEYCQTQIFGIDSGGGAGQSYAGSSVFVYGLNTVGAVSMVDRNGASLAAQSANTGLFASHLVRFVTKVPGT
ncbi:beta-1,3-exoglucanase [Drepanopeziza brunnea f. sp. 'multigermtubi' MB_m1]|uniref:Beta-1,3-exoglucanase n=1 Tax=Marssonina brunnea f. sp. multigermtubi (strain MB_m1) TaxID=1072389 RepID=K1Y667_MARBU|nr:beta-1,3-exoglucanase [Drepanopeziza brunnea f. sp. 'multigermtubi' MB_m1]EKD20654.1 beta-1,3-exoglucanase [Drepanopeziza brunnea f. sp. 'multigermtubi' MB_m1]